MKATHKRGFTLPGEAGYESLTLALAERWGADVIRDSDGTVLSDEILGAGYGIYSTICPIREHNAFLRRNPQYQQQCFLISRERTATGGPLTLPLLEGYFTDQFEINHTPESLALWQVYDRTTGDEIPPGRWQFHAAAGSVVVADATPYHCYTVNFLAFRIWEEISMYNHVTNGWNREHLMQLDPVYPEAQAYLLQYLRQWCESHPHTDVVRFTSLFYNFAWIWGDDAGARSLFTDWGSYDFTVSPRMLRQFAQRHGYALTSEDFVNGGLRNPCHMPPSPHMRDYMDFVCDFVVALGRQLVDIVHAAGKKAYLFYDDSWVGTEPGSGRFAQLGFDGIIKCVFSGFEARLCSAVEGVDIHELRLHPYLFPEGLGGAPTFAPGGQPGRDTLQYWVQVRRALLRQPVDRLGLGGYLHLVQGYPDFLAAMDQITDEFAQIRELHACGAPEPLPCRIGIATAWGGLRRWTCGGHYHEHPELDLLNLLESLSGMPFDVEFFSFEQLQNGVPDSIDLLVNAGFAGSAWSGGDAWKNPLLVESVTRFVHNGGALLGVGQPACVPDRFPHFRLAHILGVDEWQPALLCHGEIHAPPQPADPHSFAARMQIAAGVTVRALTPHTQILCSDAHGQPLITRNAFGDGVGIYLAQYRHTPANSAALRNMLLQVTGTEPPDKQGLSPGQGPTPGVEYHIFPACGKVALVSSLDHPCSGTLPLNGVQHPYSLPAFGMSVQAMLPGREAE